MPTDTGELKTPGALTGRVALVTGAARGIGAAIAAAFVDAGATVVLADIDDHTADTARRLGPSAQAVHLDVGSEADWSEALDVLHELGRLDVLVNNAAIVRPSSFEDTTLADFTEVVRVNQIGTFLGIRAAIAPMRSTGGGSIINVSSIAGVRPKNGLVSYTATKAAVRAITRTAALELGRYGIRVNAIVPGNVDTDMAASATNLGALRERFAGYPIGRIGRPREIAAMAEFLAADSSSYCTGSEFVVDGGFLAGDVVDFLPGGPSSTS